MTFTPYYRTGGPARFQWHKAAAHPTREAALKVAEEIQNMGYHCLVQETETLNRIGLPETWAAWLPAVEVTHE